MSRRNSKCTQLDSFLAGLSKGIIMDINRNKRKGRTTGGDEAGEFSQQSILSAMDRFVAAVNNMDDTVMVPSRLMDMALHGGDGDKANNNNSSSKKTAVVPRSVVNADMFGFYNMLNAVKNELIWGPTDGVHPAVIKEKPEPPTPVTVSSGNNHPVVGGGGGGGHKPGHARRLSQVSTQSYSDSDVESESSTEFDSGVEMMSSAVSDAGGEGSADGKEESQVAVAFRQHLTGLFHALEQLTDAANFLSTRYQDEIDAANS